MAENLRAFRVQAGSELGQLLDVAAETDVFLEMEGIRFRLYRVEATTSPGASRDQRNLSPERVLNIIGLGAAKRESDIARFKDQYIADAAAERGE
jgi:hypothetical protein